MFFIILNYNIYGDINMEKTVEIIEAEYVLQKVQSIQFYK